MGDNGYGRFVRNKAQLDGDFGFEPKFVPSFLFDFQADLVRWAVRKGRAAIFADCGLGKTLMELVWADNVHQHTGKPILILTPLAVGAQFEREASRFGLDAARSSGGKPNTSIVITNYERLHLFDPDEYGGVVCDESSILKSFDGMRRKQITEFMRLKKYRLLGTATAAPNNFTELGTSSEALGYLGHMDMLSRYFTNKRRTTHQIRGRWRDADNGWRFKGHAVQSFWRWVASWARALRNPSDMGYDDNGFILPSLNIEQHKVKPNSPPPGMLLNLPAVGLQEQRAERRRTIDERCEMAATLANGTDEAVVMWASLNDEADRLERLVPDAVQVAGRHSSEVKEERLESFSNGDVRVLVTKPKIGAWGLNWQHCNHITFFPTHSYEQYYQAVRRCWRFGQERPVTVDIVATEGEVLVQENLQKKAKQADQMFIELVAHMKDSIEVNRLNAYTRDVRVPTWLS